MNNIIVDNNKLCDDNLYIYQDIKSVEVLGTSTLNINANIRCLPRLFASKRRGNN